MVKFIANKTCICYLFCVFGRLYFKSVGKLWFFLCLGRFILWQNIYRIKFLECYCVYIKLTAQVLQSLRNENLLHWKNDANANNCIKYSNTMSWWPQLN